MIVTNTEVDAQQTHRMGFWKEGRSLLGYLRHGSFQCLAEYTWRRLSGNCSNRSCGAPEGGGQVFAPFVVELAQCTNWEGSKYVFQGGFSCVRPLCLF